MVLSGNIKNDAVTLVCALLTGLSGKEGTYQIRHRFFTYPCIDGIWSIMHI